MSAPISIFALVDSTGCFWEGYNSKQEADDWLSRCESPNDLQVTRLVPADSVAEFLDELLKMQLDLDSDHAGGFMSDRIEEWRKDNKL